MDYSRQRPFQTTSFVFAVALVMMLAGWGLYAYLFHSVREIAEQTSTLTAETAKLQSEQSEEMQLKSDLATNQAQQPVLNSYFVDATDPVPLFETLESYGQDTGVAVSIDSVDVKRSPDRLLVSVTGDGSFEDVYRFIALIEAAPYEFSVANATVRSMAAPAPQNAAPGKAVAKPATVWDADITLSIASVINAAAAAGTAK